MNDTNTNPTIKLQADDYDVRYVTAFASYAELLTKCRGGYVPTLDVRGDAMVNSFNERLRLDAGLRIATDLDALGLAWHRARAPRAKVREVSK